MKYSCLALTILLAPLVQASQADAIIKDSSEVIARRSEVDLFLTQSSSDKKNLSRLLQEGATVVVADDHGDEEHADEEEHADDHGDEEHADEEEHADDHADEEHADEEEHADDHADEEHADEEEHADDHADEEHADEEEHTDEEHHDEEEDHDHDEEEEDHDHDEEEENHDHDEEEHHDEEEDHDHDEEDHHDEEEDHDHDEEDHHDEEEDHDHDEEEHHDEEEDHDHDEEDHHDDEEDHDHDHEDEHDHDDHGNSSLMFGEGQKKPWGTVFWNTLIVNLTALTGVIVFIPALFKGTNLLKKGGNEAKITRRIFDIAVPGFAAGALFATAAMLILPEALNFIKQGVEASHAGEEDSHDSHDSHDDHEGHDDHDDDLESEINSKFGLSLLFGFFIPMMIGAFFPVHKMVEETQSVQVIEAETGVLSETDVEDPEKPVEIEESNSNLKKPINWKLICSILIGDGFHNFSDGVFIGIAFMICSRSIAVAIMISTVYHEMAQELADYFLLTQHAGLKPFQALLLNFVSGLTVTIGGFVILGAPLTWDAVGIILGLSGGVYIHIAASECIPRMENGIESFKDRMLSILCLGLGALPIGLVLLDHHHCVEH